MTASNNVLFLVTYNNTNYVFLCITVQLRYELPQLKELEMSLVLIHIFMCAILVLFG